MNDTIVNDTDKVTLDCQADGYPSPTIRWIFVSNKSFVPGTFRITGRQEEGFYRCIADNGVGNPATRDVFITVLRKSDSSLSVVASWDTIIKYKVVCLVILFNSTVKQRITLLIRLPLYLYNNLKMVLSYWSVMKYQGVLWLETLHLKHVKCTPTLFFYYPVDLYLTLVFFLWKMRFVKRKHG